jgi:hypothetical protein
VSAAGPSPLLELEAAIAADLEQRRPRAMQAWTRLFLELPTKEAQADYIGRLTKRHGERVAQAVTIEAVLARCIAKPMPDERKSYLARVEREMGRAVADAVRDRLMEQWYRQGTNENVGNDDVGAGDPAGAVDVPGRALT